MTRLELRVVIADEPRVRGLAVRPRQQLIRETLRRLREDDP